MSSKDQVEEPIWKFVKSRKPLRLSVQGVIVFTFMVGAWTLAKPAFEYAESKFNYMFAIKPEDKLLLKDKYSFWAGFTLFESTHPSANTDDFLDSYFYGRQKLLKSIEVLGFDDRGAASVPDVKTINIAKRMARNFELRGRLEGFLENKNNGSLELYRSGFVLASLITELQSANVDRSKVHTLVKRFSLNWEKAQQEINYRLIKVELTYSEDEYFIYSQPNLMRKAISSLEKIRAFYGEI